MTRLAPDSAGDPLRDLFKQAAESVAVPPLERVWRRVEVRLLGSNVVPRRVRLSLVAVSIVICVVALSTFSRSHVQALGQRVAGVVGIRIRDSVANVFFGPIQPAPPIQDHGAQIGPSTLLPVQNIQSQAPFIVRLPTRLPEDARLLGGHLTWKGEDRKLARVTLQYTGPKGDFTLLEANLSAQSAGGYLHDRDDSTLETVGLGEVDGLWLEHKTGVNRLLWESHGIHFELVGRLSRAEAIAIALSVQ